MKTDLSSQITLTRIPQRYYRPENAFEHSVLTRLEKIPTNIYESADEGSFAIAKEIADQIRKKQEIGENFVMAIPGGRSPLSVYKELIRMHKEEQLSFRNVVVFVEYEFFPLVSPSAGNVAQLKEALLDHIDIAPENIYAPDGCMPKDAIIDFCRMYEENIQKAGGLDYILLGVGHASNIMFNGVGSTLSSRTRLVLLEGAARKEASRTFPSLDNVPAGVITMGIATMMKARGHASNIMFNGVGSTLSSRTRLVLLEGAARKEASRTFPSLDNVPAGVITMGIATMMKARNVILMAWGEDKAKIIAKTVEGKVSDAVPSSYLQNHTNAKVVVDLSAAYDLTRISHPWLVTNCEWDNKLIRRAIVWLCQLTGKPILKLTNKDYSENGLGELLALYGSAYNVNIRVFNDIQHTITGWPGGKPNADDSNRPERATPYPKKVIIFSPHPDDDVISMGGTFHRLCEQHHDVHVAYETSGNIAVGDEEVIRYCEYLRDVCAKYTEDETVKKKAEEIIHFLRYEKVEGEAEKRDVLFMKGTIRREEARAGARYSGIKSDDHIHFLDLPFYETGLVKKNDLSEADIAIVKKLLTDVKPDEMFVAGDLADPHGTHRVCLNAVLAAIDELKDEEWLKNCRIWMYRGAWAEWEMDHVEMAVPISPEELRHKRNAILKHQSQAESAPFLGDDERLFWQRAEDRNRATAELYHQLGLASYEAMEAFVQYVPVR